jgi:Rieske [2Fe-2S] domain
MVAFFDPNLSEQWGGAFLSEDSIESALRALIPHASISTGQYSCPSRADLRDLAWNHMDQNHRPTIHKTYFDAVRAYVGEGAAFSLTRLNRWPFVIPVFDGRHKENGFYQIMCLFGVVVILSIIECERFGGATRMNVRWFIATHRLLRFLHGSIGRRLKRLNEEQNRDDDAIRDRRADLRARGYRFKTDVPDFKNANVVANNTIFPAFAAPWQMAVADLPLGAPVRIEAGDRAYIFRRASSDDIEVWPGICLHEGAALGPADLQPGGVKCHWHGLVWPARRLSAASAGIDLCGGRIELTAGRITIRAIPVGETRSSSVPADHA